MGMKKKVLWGTVRIALVLLLAWGLCKVFSNYLDGQITELYRLNQTQVNAANGTEQKDKGAVLFAETFRNDTGMLVMGSSELGSPVPERTFRIQGTLMCRMRCRLCCWGRTVTQ